MEASKLFVPGMWMCPQCGFVQQNNVLSPKGVFANTKPELRPCPNDGRDMQPVTWQEYAERTDKAFGKVLDEREALQQKLQVVYDLSPELKTEGMEHFEGYFCHWDKIIMFAAAVGVDGYAQSPMELLTKLVNQRDEAREQLEACKARSVTWHEVQARKPEPCQPVIGYSPEWEDEDFNAAGIRECFLMDEGHWLSAKWDNEQDCWQTDDRTAPTQWMSLVGMTPSKIFNHGVKSACHEGTGWVLYDADGESLEEWPKGWPETVNAAWLRSRGVEVGV